jgi:hypothetical protein
MNDLELAMLYWLWWKHEEHQLYTELLLAAELDEEEDDVGRESITHEVDDVR